MAKKPLGSLVDTIKKASRAKGISPEDKRRAGPPFQLPNTHSLRATDAACWALDIDMLKNSEGLCHEILRAETLTPNRNYLLTLLDLDKQRIAQFEQLLAGTGAY